MAVKDVSGKSFLVLTGVLAVIGGGYFVWPGPQMRADNAERARKEQEVRSSKEAEREAVASAERAAERKRLDALTRNATDEDLNGLVRECKRSIEESLSKQTTQFAVYFPNYSASELDSIYAGSVATRMKMGRPSVAATEIDTEAAVLAQLREFPSLPVKITVESATDSFSGVKRWAATYTCRIKGVQVDSVAMDKRYFID